MKHQRGLVVRGMSYEVNKLNEYCIYTVYIIMNLLSNRVCPYNLQSITEDARRYLCDVPVFTIYVDVV
jgi:hypothetical protein